MDKKEINNTQIAINHLKVGSQSMMHIDLAVKALEKQIPKKPMSMQNAEPEYMCECGRKYYHKGVVDYCSGCGQKLDWEC